MSTFNKFNKFVADVANKVHNLGTDTLKIMLTNTAPVAVNSIKTDITEIAAGNGYTAGGATVAIASSVQAAGLYKLISSSATIVFTAAGGSIATFQYVVIYNSTAAGQALIGWWDAGSAQVITSGNTFTVNLDTTNGIIQLQ